MESRFIEIEHKYLIDAAFDRASFTNQLLALKPLRHGNFQPSDTYYIRNSEPGFVYRYRDDYDLQELTVKTRGNDIEKRTEINIALPTDQGSQLDVVTKFLATLDATLCGTLRKDVELFEFSDAEVAVYTATFGSKKVQCVEFEALHCKSVDEALACIKKYETKFGFVADQRCKQSLFDLLLVAL